MDKLRREMTEFFQKLYVDQQKLLVFGEGACPARVALIGEAPGEQETLEGRPFVGRAGKNLDEFLAMSGIRRGDVYITNTVKFRPVKKSAAGNTVNRAPSQEEITLCLPFLKRELALVDPGVIVTLGNVPLKALIGRKATVGELHGQWLEWERRRLYPLYHPASIIYNRSLRPAYEADVMRLGEALRQGSWRR